MRLQGDFNAQGFASVAAEPDLLVNESRKSLYPVENGFNFELNSWSPGRWSVWYATHRLIGAQGVSYSFMPLRSRPQSRRSAPAAERKVKGRVADWDGRRSEPVFRSQRAAQIVRKGTQSAGLPLTGGRPAFPPARQQITHKFCYRALFPSL